MLKRGRKSKYNEDPEFYNQMVKQYAREGLTDKEICIKFDISEPTFYSWIKRFPNFFKSLKDSKPYVDSLVEQSLLKRALGYDYEEVKEIIENDKVVKIEKIKKHCQPNVTAQIFWLKNRQKEQWREKQHDVPEDDKDKIKEIEFVDDNDD